MEKKIILVKTVIAIVIGSALVFVLMRFASISTGVKDTYLNWGIVILSILAAIFGPIAGVLIGFIGHTLTDLTRGNVLWAWSNVWWTWVIADALYGFAVGIFWKLYRIEEKEFGITQAVIFNGVQIFANILAWVAIAPTLDVLIKHQQADEAYLQGLVASTLNIAVVLVLGTLLIIGYSKVDSKVESLKAE